METTKQRCLNFLIQRGMFDSQAEQVLERAKPDIEVGGYQMTWDRPASEYPDVLYAVIGLILKRHALEWIDEHAPLAWFRPMFADSVETETA